MIETGSLDRYESSLRKFSRNDHDELKYQFSTKTQEIGEYDLKNKKVKFLHLKMLWRRRMLEPLVEMEY